MFSVSRKKQDCYGTLHALHTGPPARLERFADTHSCRLAGPNEMHEGSGLGSLQREFSSSCD